MPNVSTLITHPNMSQKTIILGTAHRVNVGGNRSPNGVLREYRFSRDVCKRLKKELEADGFQVFIDIEEDRIEGTQSQELIQRCKIVNALCSRFGKANCIYISIHVDAAGSTGEWRTAGGWTAYTSRGRTRADALATCLYEAAQVALADYAAQFEEKRKRGLYDAKQKPFRTDYSDGDPDKEAGFYVLAHTVCPAVLTENLFQDNRADVEFLTSETGIQAIVQLHKDGILRFFKHENQ